MAPRLLTLLSILLAVVIGAAIHYLDRENLSAVGSILSGGGSLLAVLWFSAGLRYQANQLEEQRQQFAAQFAFIKESSRRESLLVVQGILERAEARAITSLGEHIDIAALPLKYMNSPELKTIFESEDPHEVMESCQTWMKKETAALTLLRGIKSAAEVYLRSTRVDGIDFTKTPEEFYFIYSPRFADEPFFNTLASTALTLSEFMVRLKPGRDAVLIALLAATAKAISPDVVKIEKLREDIARQQADGRLIPTIARDV